MKKLTEKQLIRDIEELARLAKGIKSPQKGWVRQLREILNMPAKALAKRCGIARSTVSRLEQSEQNKSITLNSLERLANGLNCELRYIFVPRQPIDQYLKKQAVNTAKKEVLKVSHTMSLEDQKTAKNHLENQIEDLAEELLSKRSRTIWEEE